MEVVENITKEQWQGFLAQNSNAHIFNTWKWGEFKKGQGWRPIRLAVKDRGEVIGLLPILKKQIPVLGKKFWYLPRGPVFNVEHLNSQKIFEQLIEFARKEKVISLKISPEIILSEKSKDLKNHLIGLGFCETKEKNCQLHKCTIRVDLVPNIEQILSNFKKNTRWEVKRAEEKGVVIKQGSLDNFYSVYQSSMQKNKQDFLPKGYISGLCQFFPQNYLILTAHKDTILLSGIFILFFNQRAWYMFGGSTRQAGNFYENQLLQSEAIKMLKQRGIKEYDLQGVACSPKTAYEISAFSFKDGFGGKRVELIGEFDKVFSLFWHFLIYRMLSPVYRLFSKNH